MISKPSTEDIERQMAALRSVLRRDASDLASEVRVLADWRYHFRNHPWVFCGAAAIFGFLLVPRTRESHSAVSPIDRELVQRLAAELELRNDNNSHLKSARCGENVVRSLLVLATNSLAQQTVTFALDKLHSAVSRRSQQTSNATAVKEGTP